MRINPSIVIHMDIKQQASCDRLGKKKIDPVTGCEYNLGTQLVKDVDVKARLVNAKEDNRDYVKNGFSHWSTHLTALEDLYEN